MGAQGIAIIGAIIGALTGGLTFLFKQLVDTKNQRINELVDERDYWRDMLIKSGGGSLTDYQTWFNQQHPPTPQERPGREQPIE